MVGFQLADLIVSENGAYVSHKNMKTGLPVGFPVTEYETVATVGYSEYIETPGHFYNEVLQRLVHMDAILPDYIPMFWPAGELPHRVMLTLQDMGIVSRTRTFIPLGGPGAKSLSRAKALYFYGTTQALQISPVVTWFSQNYLTARFRKYYAAKLEGAGSRTRNAILVMRRPVGRSRSIANHDDLMAALQKRFPDVPVEDWLATPDNLVETGESVYNAAVILGTHGANLNNLIFARRGASAIEFGYVNTGGFHWPSEFVCIARNLGLHYWPSVVVDGDHDSPVKVDINRTLAIVTDALAAASPIDGWE